jgi:uncharacterized membrane protein (UPF0182 family)
LARHQESNDLAQGKCHQSRALGGGGLPQYLVDNLPAESQYGMNISQPAIYCGEVAPGCKIVSTGYRLLTAGIMAKYKNSKTGESEELADP